MADGTDRTGAATPPRVALAWSGGKDAALALQRLRDRADVRVVELLTTREGDRTKAHRLRPGVVERQADAAGLPLAFVDLPAGADNDAYEAGLQRAFAAAAERGVDAVAYADLHLADVRSYREGLLADAPVEGCWPVWGEDTAALADAFVEAGFAATLVAVEDDALGPGYAGMDYADALAQLPEGVDPCGENGEFHTVVTDGPVFDRGVQVELGDLTTEAGEHAGRTVHYRDVVPAE
jgi:uncharacterized protein (TIGR00290 family)